MATQELRIKIDFYEIKRFRGNMIHIPKLFSMSTSSQFRKQYFERGCKKKVWGIWRLESTMSSIFLDVRCLIFHSFLPPKIKGVGEGGGLIFKTWAKRGGSLRNCSEIGGLIYFIGFSSEKHLHYYWNIYFFFFCLVNIYDCCNQ